MPHPRTALQHLPPAFWWGAGLIVVLHLAAWWLSQPWLLGVLASVLMLGLGARWGQSWSQCRADMAECKLVLQQLRQAQASKNELLATVSHELRTPLNVLLGLHPFIQEATHNDVQAQRVLQHMQAATQALLQASQTILDMSQPSPPATVPRTAPMPSADAQRAITEQPWRFLVVDDNPLNVLVLRLMLEKKFPQAQVVCVNGAAAAMHCLDHEPLPDAMLLDVMMPGIDGYALARWVRQHARAAVSGLPMVAITGTLRSEDAALRLGCGINQVVYKPLDPHQLVARVCEVLRLASHRGAA